MIKKILIHLLPVVCLMFGLNNVNTQSEKLKKLLPYKDGEFSSSKQAKSDIDYYSIYFGNA